MVPDIPNRGDGLGTSFKGALSYYLHDKREDKDSPHLSTSERVAWTETRNLTPGIDVRMAQRVMIATSKNADKLKAEAGIKNTGRKSDLVVFHYSLSWQPGEAAALTREEMVRATDASLKILGAENRQAVLVCHTDRAHPHVHIIINRVDPDDGRLLGTSNTKRKLSNWANEYERERGQILTPLREEKRQQREQNADRAERREYADRQRAAAEERAHGNRSRAAMLKELGDRQKIQHREQWNGLAERNKAGREKIYRDSSARIKDTLARHKVESKPIWAEHFRAKRKAERGFLHRERSLAGVVVNALDAAKHQKRSGQLQDRGLLSATIRNMFSDQDRERAFNEAQDITRKQLTDRLRSIGDRGEAAVKEQRTGDLAEHRQAFQNERAELIDRQDGDRAKVREAWKQIYDERGQRQPRRAEPGQKPCWQRDRPSGGDRRREPSIVAPPFDRKAAYEAIKGEARPEIDRKALFAKMKNIHVDRRPDDDKDRAEKMAEQEWHGRKPRGPSWERD